MSKTKTRPVVLEAIDARTSEGDYSGFTYTELGDWLTARGEKPDRSREGRVEQVIGIKAAEEVRSNRMGRPRKVRGERRDRTIGLGTDEWADLKELAPDSRTGWADRIRWMLETLQAREPAGAGA